MKKLTKKTDKPRCFWATPANPLMMHYHDTEWGLASHDERHLFEHLILEIFQAGLSWSTILNKRENFRRAFRKFNTLAISRFGAKDVTRLMNDKGIIRNRRKIEATIHNAKALVAFKKNGGNLADLVWQFAPKKRKKTITRRNMPTQTVESAALAKTLKSHGFTFVGPTGCYAFMQAVGIVNDHTKSCFRWNGPC